MEMDNKVFDYLNAWLNEKVRDWDYIYQKKDNISIISRKNMEMDNKVFDYSIE
jgi:hypothetical protein